MDLLFRGKKYWLMENKKSILMFKRPIPDSLESVFWEISVLLEQVYFGKLGNSTILPDYCQSDGRVYRRCISLQSDRVVSGGCPEKVGRRASDYLYYGTGRFYNDRSLYRADHCSIWRQHRGTWSKQPKKQRQNLEFRKIDGTDKKSLGIWKKIDENSFWKNEK